MSLKTAVCVANNEGPDQMPYSVVSGQGLHCLLKPVCPSTKIITVVMFVKYDETNY